MSVITQILSLLLLISPSYSHSSEYGIPATTLQLPLFSVPLPPVDTRCYTFDLYMDRSNLSSLNSEDFSLLRNTGIIRARTVCETGESSSHGQSFFCVETEIQLDDKMCNANHRSSILICRKWWGEKYQELANATFSNNPPNPKNIAALCIIFPNKPWCDPNQVCAWYPKIPRCQKRNVSHPLTHSLSPSVLQDVWYIAGILKDNNYRNDCNISKTTIRSNDLFLRLTYPKEKMQIN